MVTTNEHGTRSSVHVAPLTIHKDRARGSSQSSKHTRDSSRSSHQTKGSTSSQSQMTPPATPNGSQEDLNRQMDMPQPVFHNFLRAFYPFHPNLTITDTTVTLPLNEGDVVLVHSIHTNGWADGTLLISGARGWLPTNYCEAYDPESMRNLLKALLNFWDLLRSGLTSDSEVFGNQEFMRGIIAGVRYLLEKSSCLTRESPKVQGNEALRRSRKSILSDLSGLVKTAKRLQEYVSSQTQTHIEADDVNHTIDEMILKAFRLVTRGVRFLDTLEDDMRISQPVHKVMATVAEEPYNPPTPPADLTSFYGVSQRDLGIDAASRGSSNSPASRLSGSHNPTQAQTDEQLNRYSNKRASYSYPNNATTARPLSMNRPASVHFNRQSISHRLSLTASVPAAQREHLVSEQLNARHDTFLSFVGSFIGRLHLQSQSSAELISAIRQSVTAGRELLKVIEVISTHDVQSAEALEASRNAMYDRVNKLVTVAADIMSSASVEEDDLVMPQQNGRLLMAATACVKAAGECVAKTKFVIERIGDFESESTGDDLRIDTASIGVALVDAAPELTADLPAEPAIRPPPPPLIIPSCQKPLPDVPAASLPTTEDSVPHLSSGDLDLVAESEVAESSTTESSNRSSRRSLLPPLPKMTSPFLFQDEYSPSEHSSVQDSDFQQRIGSIAISTSGKSSNYMGNLRDSESSMISATSTRATTPDLSSNGPNNQPFLSDTSLAGSYSTVADDPDDGETKILEKTFAHELLHNKDGQITGGTLPALVERLTTHDSTPDSLFVSTFYLTFRLFASPIELAQALVDRFDYVAESPHVAGPVRLRVYNVFKGWLESHWRDLSDHDALSVIAPFATEKLGKLIPGAGKRLLELAQKVSSTDGPLVPRQISSMGKTSTSIAQYIPADTPLPATNMTKSQMSTLRNWKMGGSMPSILDFDPLEVARQLTIKEMNIFCEIMPEELLGSEWTKHSGSNAVNVRAMSTLSTDLSNLVADTILQYDDAKKRAVIVKQWIKIAHKCLELNNYDSLMAIICSLNSSMITRLKKTWDVVSPRRKDMLRVLQSIVQPDKNYAVLRRRLHDHVPPCLPFVGTYLTDLTFVDAGNPDTKQLPGTGADNGMAVINFDKHTRTAKIIGELQRFQIPYRLAEVPELQEWIQAQIVRVKSSPEHENVQQFYRKSLLLEPREVVQPRQSPIDSSSSFSSKDKFDIFAWTHSKDKSSTAPTPI